MVAIALALGAIELFPRSGGDQPPFAALALIGAVIAGVTTVALYTIVRKDLRLPSRAAASLAFAFVLIALVKFILAPLGLYEVNAVRALDELFGSVADLGGAALTAAVVFVLYALGYTIVYRVGYRDRLPIPRRNVDPDRFPIVERSIVTGIVMGLLVVSGLGFLVIVFLTAPRQYLEFVFSSGAGLIVVAALAMAATLIGSVFRALSRRPEVVADVGAVVTLFWLGLGFLALYHVLWIVYVLVLGSIWPLRTVVPK
ncbi:MAG TPA: hypothetical protein VMR89_02220 [Actinomycetota bacterium]|nr:hypothetical protein [Actinomycetota bacterium]